MQITWVEDFLLANRAGRFEYEAVAKYVGITQNSCGVTFLFKTSEICKHGGEKDIRLSTSPLVRFILIPLSCFLTIGFHSLLFHKERCCLLPWSSLLLRNYVYSNGTTLKAMVGELWFVPLLESFILGCSSYFRWLYIPCMYSHSICVKWFCWNHLSFSRFLVLWGSWKEFFFTAIQKTLHFVHWGFSFTEEFCCTQTNIQRHKIYVTYACSLHQCYSHWGFITCPPVCVKVSCSL